MGSRDYSYKIGAKDDLSSAVSKMASTAKRELGKIDDAIDETGSKGKQFARIISQMADDVDDELTKTATAADRLGEALGPELEAKIGRGGVEQFVGDMRRAGLTFEDIEADADELATSIRKLDDVASKAGHSTAQAFDTGLTPAIHKTAGEAERTGSVFANFAGNAAQDIPGISGSFGALNVAVGQFAEYATEGGIAIKKLLLAMGPIAAGTLVIAKLNEQQQRAAESAAENAEQVDMMAEAVRDAKDPVEALAEQWRETGEVMVGVGSQGVQNFLGPLVQAGMTVDQFSTLVGGSREQLEAWRAAMEASGQWTQATFGIYIAAGQEIDNVAAATNQAAAQTAFFGEEVQHTAVDVEALTSAAEASVGAVDALGGAADTTASAIRQMWGETLTGTELQANFEEALDDVTDSIKANGATLDLNTAKGRANFNAAKAAAEAAMDRVAALVEEGASLDDATAYGQAYVDQLAETLRQAGLTDAQILTYIDTLNLTPTDIETVVTAAGVQTQQGFVEQYHGALDRLPAEKRTQVMALIDQGRYDEARRLLDQLTAPRSVRVTIDPRYGQGTIPLSIVPNSTLAEGGTAYPGTINQVGEGGKPELLYQNGRQYLIPGDSGPAQVVPFSGGASGAGAGAGAVVFDFSGATIIANNPEQFFDSVKRFVRMNGNGELLAALGIRN